MFDAWENGGQVDGKPVTDGRLRDYIAMRRDSMGKEDPLYDEWNNRLIQLDFRIGEEKVQLAFQQGKASAGAVAAFYRGQLGKIPKDSAFYREVAGRAAQWAKATAGAARGAARARIGASLSGKQDSVARTWGNYTSLEGIITEAAKRAGLIAGNQTLVDADASRLLDLFNAGIIGPNGQAITYLDWQQASVDAYKAFDTQIAINKQLNRGYKELTEQKGKFLDQNLVRINTIDDRAKYEAARDLWLEEVANAQGNPSAILAANARYTSTLEKVMASASQDTGLAKTDPEFIGGLTNELNAVRDGKFTGPTVFDLQSTSGEGVTTQDAEETAQSVQSLMADAKALDSGAAFYGQDEYGGPLKVVYFAPGSALDPFGRQGLGPDSQPAVLSINGKPTQVVLKGQPVKSSALVDPNGQPVEQVDDGKGHFIPVQNLTANDIAYLLSNGFTKEEGSVVGYVFQQGSEQKFGVIDPATGEMKFTDSNPFAGTFTIGEAGFEVFAASTYDDAGKIKVGQPVPTFNLATADNLLVDPTVSPADIRSAAKTEIDPDKQAALLALADKRQNSFGSPERDLQQRAIGRTKGSAQPTFGSEVTGYAQDLIRNALGVAQEIKASSAPPAITLAQNIPFIGKALGGVPQIASQPNVPSPAQAAGSTIGGAVGDLLNKIKPPTPAQAGASAGSSAGSAVADLLEKLKQPPPPPPSGGTNKTQGNLLS